MERVGKPARDVCTPAIACAIMPSLWGMRSGRTMFLYSIAVNPLRRHAPDDPALLIRAIYPDLFG